jgi:hypothetical protein
MVPDGFLNIHPICPIWAKLTSAAVIFFNLKNRRPILSFEIKLKKSLTITKPQKQMKSAFIVPKAAAAVAGSPPPSERAETEISAVMPTADQLGARFGEWALDHFAEKTGIVRNLAGRTLFPLGLRIAMELALADYARCVDRTCFVTAKLNVYAVFEQIADEADAKFGAAYRAIELSM